MLLNDLLGFKSCQIFQKKGSLVQPHVSLQNSFSAPCHRFIQVWGTLLEGWTAVFRKIFPHWCFVDGGGRCLTRHSKSFSEPFWSVWKHLHVLCFSNLFRILLYPSVHAHNHETAAFTELQLLSPSHLPQGGVRGLQKAASLQQQSRRDRQWSTGRRGKVWGSTEASIIGKCECILHWQAPDLDQCLHFSRSRTKIILVFLWKSHNPPVEFVLRPCLLQYSTLNKASIQYL